MKKLLFLMAICSPFSLVSQNASEIVRKAEEKLKGEENSYSEMSMTIVRPKYQRVLEFKSWSETAGNSLTLITAPAKEKGQSFLKNGNNIWNWSPAIQRLVKLLPAMMSQGWMGSDFTNDDVVKESSYTKDFTHSLLGSETIENFSCYKIQLTAKQDVNVVWGKIIMWISEKDFLEMKLEFYDEDNELVKTHKSSKVLDFQGRRLPSVTEIIPAETPGNKTVVTIKSMKFNINVPANFFTQQNMKKVL
jgi:outer membrane lipoprotein-sorting protein